MIDLNIIKSETANFSWLVNPTRQFGVYHSRTWAVYKVVPCIDGDVASWLVTSDVRIDPGGEYLVTHSTC